jgi:hypothetical protein
MPYREESFHPIRSYFLSTDQLASRRPRTETVFHGGGRANECNTYFPPLGVRPMPWHIVRNVVGAGRASFYFPLPNWISP